MPTITSSQRLEFKRTRTSRTNNGAWGANSPAGDVTINYVQSITKGGPIANWRTKIASRRSASSGLSFSGYSADCEPGIVIVRRTNYNAQGVVLSTLDGKCEGYVTLPSNIPPIAAPTLSTSRARNRALMSFLSNATSARQSLSGQVVVGELAETLRFMRGPLKGAWRLLLLANRRAKRTVKRAKTKSQKSAARRAIGDQYLETVFAVNPLLSDVNGAAKALANICNYRMPSLPVRGFGEEIGNLSDIQSTVSNTNHTLKLVHRRSDRAAVKIYGVLLMRSGFSGGLEELGLLPRDFLPALWNVLPYSFIVDYFSNCGAIIEAASFCRSDFAYVNEGLLTERNVEFQSCEVSLPAGTPTTTYRITAISPGSCSFSRQSKVRSVYDGPWVPSLELKLPGNGLKWLNLGALLNARV